MLSLASLSPSTLINPQAAGDLASNATSGTPIWLLVLGALLFIVAAYAFSRRRVRSMDPRELAFRKITHKLGYSRTEIKLIRKSAMKSGLTSPVGVVMSPSMIDRVMKHAAAS
jgi:hypothetical protein